MSATARAGTKYCLSASACHRCIQAIEAKSAAQERKVESLVAGLADPLRAEIIALARQGRRIDAIKK